ncbi:hypothetical protein CLG85_023085 [Yangia mangrovi]|uniref:DUF112 domain-containing protein n=2 Tax=Alloyangia mangrovi TaxID=1779329 RepID=A0ABT2KSE1_9RHOB|nr:tripartite tricarboxylate transporter permease [Alloyangia pacifica]MCA0946971.1 tripartite tricarboxylate transporter permease [Alloyangia pacifica]MCT4373028.1 hypothetical protein [Alloyangia mangrovi]
MLRSSRIGTWIGNLPGIGAKVGSLVACSMAQNRSSSKDAFGRARCCSATSPRWSMP